MHFTDRSDNTNSNY